MFDCPECGTLLEKDPDGGWCPKCEECWGEGDLIDYDMRVN